MDENFGEKLKQEIIDSFKPEGYRRIFSPRLNPPMHPDDIRITEEARKRLEKNMGVL